MTSRTWSLVIILIGSVAAVGWAVYGSRLPPADFTFINESEVSSVDPALITGQPEGRIAWAIFEGLTRPRAEDNLAEPGVAELPEISEDGRVYTFQLRPDALWSNGDAVTAADFHYSLQRLLAPQTASRYSYQAWYIKNARRYTMGRGGIGPGDPVEVELHPPADAPNTVRGKLLTGTLESIEGETGGDGDFRNRVFVVRIADRQRRFQATGAAGAAPSGLEFCRQVLLDFREVGVRVIAERTLEITLDHPTPYFLDLLAFYPLSPVHRGCLERHGSPGWTRPENIVSNGAFRLAVRRIRDRVRLVRSDTYWDRANVRLDVVDALSIDDRTTAFNLYMTGVVDWVPVPPPLVSKQLLASDPPRNDVNPAPQLTTYFYLLNTTRPPLDDVRIRRALSLALDRDEITRIGTGAGELPAYSLVPPSLPGYTQQTCPPRDPDEARRLLAEAGYAGGLGFPRLEIHYNTDQSHQAIAELARKQWQRELGITVTLRNEEWGSALNTQQQMNYLISRRAWGGDYLDPNTFLDMYVTGGENNCTGFSHPEYDELIAAAAREANEESRMQMLEQAERILMDELPILPMYFYVSRNLVRPRVRGFYNNLQDTHPLHAIWIDPTVDPTEPQPNEFMGRGL